MTICVEIGSNQGTDTEVYANQYDMVYAFEPVKELTANLWDKFKDYNNVIIIPFAVDTTNDFKNFNVSTEYDWGCSSLYDFSDNLKEDWDPLKLIYREYFVHSHSYLVPTITLYDFVTLYNINQIDFLHIDAQGNDLNVLRSLKDKLNIVKSGTMECSCRMDLYKNTPNRVEDAIQFLNDNNFAITKSLIQGEGNEINLTFNQIYYS
jgi:FkbM family methyltransferase